MRADADVTREIGARFHGATLGSEWATPEKRGLEALADVRPEAERYLDVGEYDAVLRAHCRL